MVDILTYLSNVDFVPPSLPPLKGYGHLVVLEDNEAVIKMIIKQRALALRHTARTQRVDLDFLFHLFRQDPSICIRYVNTKSQIADILTKGLFTAVQWSALCELIQLQDTTSGRLAPSKVEKVTQAKPPKTPAQTNKNTTTTNGSNTNLGHGLATQSGNWRKDRQSIETNTTMGQQPSEPNGDALIPIPILLTCVRSLSATLLPVSSLSRFLQ